MIGYLALGTVALSALFCAVYLRFARRRQIVDQPNQRSSHELATPHGGGLPLLMAFLGALLVLFELRAEPWLAPYVWAAAATGFLMLLGLVDDLRGLSVGVRFVSYAVVSLLTVFSMVYGHTELPPWQQLLLIACATVALLWLINLYNFMDGIDGIAGVQAVLACTAAAWFAQETDTLYSAVCLLLAAAHVGFLCFNWPPARLFMGDTGSIPTGYLIGVLALLGWTMDALNPLCWLVLLALFILDASWTVSARLLRKEDISQGHRDHAYQRLSRHWNSHRAVDFLLIAVFLLWLLPIAWLIRKSPEYGLFLVILAYLPWVIGMANLRSLK
ncbi:MAG: glycosyltransferase family 4 protein [Halioglobus sp.]